MNDALIRENFHREILGHYHRCPDTLVLNELGLNHGESRADIAVINGALVGYEIKSDHDSLARLGKQVKAYDNVFDRATVVVGHKHARSVTSLLPSHWGIFVCHVQTDIRIEFENVRCPRANRNVDPVSIAKLLWHDEALNILTTLGYPCSFRQRRAALYQQLAENLSLSNLRQHTIRCLKSRKNWPRRGRLS